MSGSIVAFGLESGTPYIFSGSASCVYHYKVTETKITINDKGEEVEEEVEVDKTGSAT